MSVFVSILLSFTPPSIDLHVFFVVVDPPQEAPPLQAYSRQSQSEATPSLKLFHS